MTVQTPSKPQLLKFQQVRRQFRLTLEQIASKAGVPVRTVYALEIGAAVSWGEAIDCIHALSVLVGRYYHFEDFFIRVRQEAVMDAPTLRLYALPGRERR